MPITLPDDYWIEIPGGRYTLGLVPDEVRRLAVEIAGWVEAEGIVPTPNDWKNMARVLEIEEETGNPAWVEKYLLARYPAREVEIAPYAIARRPVTADLYRRFTRRLTVEEVHQLQPRLGHRRRAPHRGRGGVGVVRSIGDG